MGKPAETKHGGKVWTLSRKNGVPVGEILDFSASINDFSPAFDTATYFSQEAISNYPDTDYGNYVAELSSYAGVTLDQLLLGPGLTYFIYRIAERFSGKRVLILEPTFSEYFRAFEVNQCRVDRISSDEIEDMLGHIRKGTYAIVIATRPDNPYGNAMDRSRLLELADSCLQGGATLFIDEAFLDFMGISEIKASAKMLSGYHNLVLGRSLTKILSVPSLRLGYILSSEKFISDLKGRLEPWAVSQPALIFLSGVNFSRIDSISREVVLERTRLIDEMQKLGFQLCGKPAANFATFRVPGQIEPRKLEAFCASRNILIRTLTDHHNLGDHYVRIAVKRRDKAEKLISVLRDFLSQDGLANGTGKSI